MLCKCFVFSLHIQKYFNPVWKTIIFYQEVKWRLLLCTHMLNWARKAMNDGWCMMNDGWWLIKFFWTIWSIRLTTSLRIQWYLWLIFNMQNFRICLLQFLKAVVNNSYTVFCLWSTFPLNLPSVTIQHTPTQCWIVIQLLYWKYLTSSDV